MYYHSTQEKVHCLKYCAPFHDCYYCIKKVLSYIIASAPWFDEIYYSLDELVEEYGIDTKDLGWTCKEKLWNIACNNNGNNSIKDLLMTFPSL